jgi:hypothetical protein
MAKRRVKRIKLGIQALPMRVKDGHTYGETAFDLGVSRAMVRKAIEDVRREASTSRCAGNVRHAAGHGVLAPCTSKPGKPHRVSLERCLMLRTGCL